MVQILDDRSPTSKTKAELRQKEILEAASRAFRRQGLHATGMRDIATESGMHVGNLYYYFKNKQELLAFCQKQTLTALMHLADRISRQPWQADEKLYRWITGHVVLLNEEMPGSLAHLEVEALEGRWKSEILKKRNRYESSLRHLIDEGVAEKIFRSADSGIAARAILGAANWTVKWYQPEGTQSSTQIGQEVASLLVRGLLLSARSRES